MFFIICHFFFIFFKRTLLLTLNFSWKNESFPPYGPHDHHGFTLPWRRRRQHDDDDGEWHHTGLFPLTQASEIMEAQYWKFIIIKGQLIHKEKLKSKCNQVRWLAQDHVASKLQSYIKTRICQTLASPASFLKLSLFWMNLWSLCLV